MISPDKSAILKEAKSVIEKEANALKNLSNAVTIDFYYTVKTILNTKGRVVILGIGKSGHIGRKIAATFASTGTPAMFVHPAEASHGDLGMIKKGDVVIAISKSGETTELFDLIVFCRRFGIDIIAITENVQSSLAKAAKFILVLPKIEEACPLNLAPTTSTTMTLALGDALAVTCLNVRNFQAPQFHDFHPGGKLGQVLTRVRDIMHQADLLPLINETAVLSDAIVEMSKGRFGCVGIIDTSGSLIGIFTDGDLRRKLFQVSLHHPINTLMNKNPFTIPPDSLIADVAYLFSEKRIPSVFVCIEKKPVGIVHVHDLLKGGFI